MMNMYYIQLELFEGIHIRKLCLLDVDSDTWKS